MFFLSSYDHFQRKQIIIAKSQGLCPWPFSLSWEQRKLGEVGKARSGIGFPDAEQGGGEGIPFFKVSDMNTAGNENEMTTANNYVTEAQIASHRWHPITEVPALFFAKVGAAVMLNRKRLCRFPFLLDNNTMAYSLDKDSWDADFSKALFETVDLTSLIQVGALPSYNAGDVENMEIYLPSLCEQRIIGTLFKQLDNLITLHQREYKMDETRATTIAWEQRKLGDIVKEVTRNDPASDAPIMMITANNGFIEQSERYAFNNAGESLKKYILLERGELAYNHGASKLRPYGSCFALTTADNARIPFVYHCFSVEEHDPEFMSIELNGADVENQLRRIVSSGARMDGLLNISFEEYTSISILLPKPAEQKKIATFFRSLDNLITLHQREQISISRRKTYVKQSTRNRPLLLLLRSVDKCLQGRGGS